MDKFNEESELSRQGALECDRSSKIEEEQDGITLSRIWHMIAKHWIVLVCCTAVGFLGGVGYSKFIKTPKYQATTQIMAVNDAPSGNAQDDINLALKKAAIAYGYMSSEEVLKTVGIKMEEKGYDAYVKDSNGKKTENVDVNAVKGYYTVTIPTVTNNATSIFVNVTSTCKNKQMAIDVANFVVSSTIELVTTEGTNGYTILKNSIASMGEATNAKDNSTSTWVIALIGALIGVVVGAGYGIVRELTNTKVTSKQDLETLTGYKVIGMIPDYQLLEEIAAKKEEKKHE